jgi:CHAD domain-containing protein
MEPAFKLTSYLDGLIDSLREYGHLALNDFDVGAIHKARVASRRLSAAMDLLEPLVSRKPRKAVEKALRKLRRRLGEHRDLDVMIDRVGELGAGERFALGARILGMQLEQEREELRAGADPHVPALKLWAEVRAELKANEEGVVAVIAEAVHDRLEEVERLAADLAVPHRLRVAGKELRYAVELAEEAGVSGADEAVERLKEMQDCLGEWHDYAVLADRALKLVRKSDLAFAPDHDAQHLAELTLECLRRAHVSLGGFRKHWAEHGVEVGASLRAAFPLSRDVGPVQAGVVGELSDASAAAGSDVEASVEAIRDADHAGGEPSSGDRSAGSVGDVPAGETGGADESDGGHADLRDDGNDDLHASSHAGPTENGGPAETSVQDVYP